MNLYEVATGNITMKDNKGCIDISEWEKLILIKKWY